MCGEIYGGADAKNSSWVLQNITFEVAKGKAVGIIGQNGAGKSTLLKLVSRITEPSAGSIDLYGRVGSLLESVRVFIRNSQGAKMST